MTVVLLTHRVRQGVTDGRWTGTAAAAPRLNWHGTDTTPTVAVTLPKGCDAVWG